MINISYPFITDQLWKVPQDMAWQPPGMHTNTSNLYLLLSCPPSFLQFPIFGRRKDGDEKRDFEHTCFQLSENYVAVVDGMAEELRVCADSADQNREMFAGQEINLPKRCTAANIDMTQAAKAAYKHKVLYVSKCFARMEYW